MGRKPKAVESDLDADEREQDRANGPGARDLQHHMGLISSALQKKQDADMKLAGLYSNAEECGLDKKAIKALIKLQKQDTEKTKTDFTTLIQYAQWMKMPVGTQLAFFEDGTKTPEQNAHAEGLEAGAKGVSANRNPYPGGSKLEPVWEAGRMEGQANIIGKGSSGKVADLNTERKKRVKKGENPAAPTEPTVQEQREATGSEVFEQAKVPKKRGPKPKVPKTASGESLQ